MAQCFDSVSTSLWSRGSAITDCAQQGVYVKNTFIQVKDSEDLEPVTSFSRHRQTHKRCASEPSWVTQQLTDPQESVYFPDAEKNSPGVSSSCVASWTSGLSMESDERVAFELSTTASSPPLTHRDDESPPEIVPMDTGLSERCCYQQSHFRQLPTQTADSFDIETSYFEQSAEDQCYEGGHSSYRSHLRQPSTQTNDGFDEGGIQSMPHNVSLSNWSMSTAPSNSSGQISPNKASMQTWSCVARSQMCEQTSLLATSPSLHREISNGPAMLNSLSVDPDALLLASFANGVASGAAFAQGFAAGTAAVASGLTKQELDSNALPADSALLPGGLRPSSCQVFWCDPRAFRDTCLKDELESELHVPVKCYRTADMCMRLLRKKHNAQSKMAFRIFLVSWSNAPALVSFLTGEQFRSAQVIILCDTCGSKGCNKACTWAQQYPLVEVAVTWEDAVQSMKQRASYCQSMLSISS